ncbi:hypothetical protein RHMOL_Rhmol07G0315100 [Rhododendron molle]|uniref:Uncharacterized protein n=3 Tax=Rhododendron molle TaxID=49168 RepID=A0ACC0N7K5_RHOML|nr:hypothetical protein RHMOL_Rhmol07G0315100 [Rhododendron molle]KAI8548971.1 hypothetical protein RHMOL_Rhmol07G0315100 [Rhododendron molle]
MANDTTRVPPLGKSKLWYHAVVIIEQKRMDRYQRVEKPRAETPIDENEIRITSQGRMRSYITYAMTLLQEKGSTEIVFKAMGRAINKTVTIVELIKRRIVGLHQITSIASTDITDTWEPLEEGLLPLETTRHVSMITITLSKKELNTSSVGYQPPIPADQVKAFAEFDYEGGNVTLSSVPRYALILTQGMDIQLLSMMMEVGKGIVATPGEGVVEEVVTFVVVEEEGSMVLLLILNMMPEVTTKKLLFKAVVADAEGDIAEGVVVLDLMARFMQLLKALN